MPIMGKRTAGQVLADNVKRLKNGHHQLKSASRVASRSGKVQKTINNVENARFDPKLSTIEAIAKAFGVDPWVLIYPALDENFLLISRAYSQANASGRDLIILAARGASPLEQKSDQDDRLTNPRPSQ